MQLAPMTAIGRVVGGRTEVVDDNWGSVCAHIELHDEILGEDGYPRSRGVLSCGGRVRLRSGRRGLHLSR